MQYPLNIHSRIFKSVSSLSEFLGVLLSHIFSLDRSLDRLRQTEQTSDLTPTWVLRLLPSASRCTSPLSLSPAVSFVSASLCPFWWSEQHNCGFPRQNSCLPAEADLPRPCTAVATSHSPSTSAFSHPSTSHLDRDMSSSFRIFICR
jgi:hypothetical protein